MKTNDYSAMSTIGNPEIKESDFFSATAPNSYETFGALPDYEGEVLSSDFIKPIDCKYGDIETRMVTMEDGTRYDLVVGTPNIQRSDTAIVSTTPWWTHTKLEHNRKMVRSALRLGHHVILAGPPSGFSANNVSLSKATYDLHRTLDHELPYLDVESDQAIILGASRAAMTGIGMSVEKYSRGRKIPYADLTAPCVPRAFEKKEWPRVVAQLGIEAVSVANIAVHYKKRGQLLQYAKSLLPDDPSHVYNALRIFPGLVLGEAGRLADEAEPSTAIHIDEFEGDYWALRPEWDRKFADRPNVKIAPHSGNHVSGIAKTSTRRGINARLERVDEIRGFDGAFEDIDFKSDVFTVGYTPSDAGSAAAKYAHREPLAA